MSAALALSGDPAGSGGTGCGRAALARTDRAGFALFAILGLAAALRFYDLGGPSLWYDEIASLTFARQSLSLLWSDWMLRETNPPLYYSLLHVWLRFFGDSALALRTPGALAGVAVVLLVYRVGLELGLKRAGLLAALFTALSSLQIFSSQEARAYIFAELAALVAVLGLIRVVRAIPKKGDQTGLAIGLGLYWVGCAAALHLHTTMVALPIVSTGIFAFAWLGHQDRAWRTAALFGAANLLCLLAASWWLWLTLQQMSLPRPNHAWMVQPDPLTAVAIFTSVLMPRAPPALVIYPPVLFIPALLAAAALSGATRVILAGFFVGAPALLYLLGFISPVLTPRTLLWAQFAATLCLSTALLLLSSRLLRLALVSVLVASTIADIAATFRYREREPWNDIVAQLSEKLGSNDILLFADESIGLILDRYCEPGRCRFDHVRVAGESDGTERWAEGLWRGRVVRPSEVETLFRNRDEIWVIRRTFSRPAPLLWAVAHEEYWREITAQQMPDYLQITPWRRAGS